MVDEAITRIVLNYIEEARNAGIMVSYALLFGSYARGEATPESDLDVIIVCPELDQPDTETVINLLWELRAKTDSRIEPVPIGLQTWESGPDSIITDIARREGIVVYSNPHSNTVKHASAARA